jgi:hypothetical protein
MNRGELRMAWLQVVVLSDIFKEYLLLTIKWVGVPPNPPEAVVRFALSAFSQIISNTVKKNVIRTLVCRYQLGLQKKEKTLPPGISNCDTTVLQLFITYADAQTLRQ